MAEEKDDITEEESEAPGRGDSEDDSEEGAEAPPKKPKKEKPPLGLVILAVINFIVLGAGVGFIVWKTFFYERQLIEEVAERQKLAQQARDMEMTKTVVSLDELSINVKPQNGTYRYLQLQIQFEIIQKSVEKFKERKALITDKVVELVSAKEFDDLRSVQGKLLLKDQIERATREILDGEPVYSVNFSSYLLQ